MSARLNRLKLVIIVIKLTFPIAPVAQKRPRMTVIARHGHMYDPRNVKVYKAQLGMLAKNLYHGEPMTGALAVTIRFYRPVQKSISKVERQRRLSGVHRPTVKADVDNYIKSTLDGLNGTLWEDDRLITSLHAYKFYSDHPRIEIEVKPDE